VGDSKRLNELRDIGRNVEKVLKNEKKVIKIANKYKDCSDLYFVGRSIHLPIALEGALKLKELAYNHAEGMAGGELKHGTLALIEEGTPVVILNPEDHTYDEMLSNASEMKARGAKIIGVSNTPNGIYDEFIHIPKMNELLYPLVEVIPLQLLAYHMAVLRQRNPDYPRNLAKSVTVK
jgi:glucosamine--fructose-6-phosphate aminotransferase (isomerizing)